MGEGRKRIAVIGAGKMGSALLEGMIQGGIVSPQEIVAADSDQAKLTQLREHLGIETTTANRNAATADILLLAVKPQVIGEVLEEIAGVLIPTTLIISIAAGITLDFITRHLIPEVRVIRAMPNTPAMIGEGATALAPGRGVSADDLAHAQQIFSAVGRVVVVKEGLMDAVTGLSGSGPAYVFTIIEALADGGVAMGLDRETARILAVQTVVGSAKLLLNRPLHPGELRDMVTSPGGTTIAGIRALEEGKIRATLMAAVEAATKRSEILGKGA